MSKLLADILELPIAERIRLAQDIWDSIVDDPAATEAFEVTDEQKAELDRRIEDYEKNPDGGIPWEKVLEDMRRRHGDT